MMFFRASKSFTPSVTANTDAPVARKLSNEEDFKGFLFTEYLPADHTRIYTNTGTGNKRKLFLKNE